MKTGHWCRRNAGRPGAQTPTRGGLGHTWGTGSWQGQALGALLWAVAGWRGGRLAQLLGSIHRHLSKGWTSHFGPPEILLRPGSPEESHLYSRCDQRSWVG